MSLAIYPRREDFFPKTKRGHGTTHPQARFDGDMKIRDAFPCGHATCVLNNPRSTDLHTDQEANMREWCVAHRLSVGDKSHPHAEYRTPGEAINAVTGGR